MIRYPVKLAELRALVEAQAPGWLARAAERTETFRTLGRYQESSSIWSEVKPVYMRLQGRSKCAYCERQLEDVEIGTIEQDVEHFRPKGSVKAWPSRAGLPDVPFAASPPAGQGYYLLPYHLFNYAAACKPCNSTLKKDYFPIAGSHRLTVDDPADLADEQPYLIYPIGTIDEDPERLIMFDGTSPRPRARSGYRRRRALVTIAFFRLDDATGRKNLYLDRARWLMALFGQLDKADHGATAAARQKAQAFVDKVEASNLSPHANCARSFIRLYRTKPALAQAFAEAAEDLVLSSS